MSSRGALGDVAAVLLVPGAVFARGDAEPRGRALNRAKSPISAISAVSVEMPRNAVRRSTCQVQRGTGVERRELAFDALEVA
jgi:hypothetical protein